MTGHPTSPDDSRWFHAHPHKRFRVREVRASDKYASQQSTLLGRPVKVIVVKLLGTLITTLIPAPLPHEFDNPWVVRPNQKVVRIKSALAVMDKYKSDPNFTAAMAYAAVEDEVVDEYEQFLEERSKDRARLFAELATDVQDQTGQIEKFVDPLARSAFVTLAHEFAHRGLTNPEPSQEEEVQAYGEMAHTFTMWRASGRTVYRPTQELVRHLLNDPVEIDDAIPVIVPHAAFFIDLEDAPLSFPAFADRDTAFLFFRRAQVPRIIDDGDSQKAKDLYLVIEKAGVDFSAPLAAEVMREAFDSVLRKYENDSMDAYHLGFINDYGGMATASAVAPWPDTWSQWFERIEYDETPEEADARRFIGAFCYLLQVRRRAGLAEPLVRVKRPYHGAGTVRAVDHSVTLPRLIRPLAPSEDATEAQLLDRRHLVEGRTTRAAHTRTQYYGKGKAEKKIVTIAERPDTKTWVRADRMKEDATRVRARLAPNTQGE